jgi:hypothetical protein
MALLALVNRAMAQDSGPHEGMTDVELNDADKDHLDREKIIYSPGEASVKYIPKSNAPKDSLITPSQPAAPSKVKVEKSAPTPKSTVQKQSKNQEQDESILSFNFLYYIIQKYKLQDIVD